MPPKTPSNDNYVERRKFERAYFSSKDDVTGIILTHNQLTAPTTGNISHVSTGSNTKDLGINGNISDLSLGGLYLVVKKERALDLNIGSIPTLKEIQATILYNLELYVEMKIRRINNYEFIEHTGIGCEFTSINAKSFESIKKLVEWGLHTNDSTMSCYPSQEPSSSP